jgi:phosphoribosylamine--glycine ligase
MGRRVLVIGGGGREHSLCWAIAKSPLCAALYCAPGNAGIAEIAECVDIAASDIERIVAFCADNTIDFVVIGPEDPLVRGLADALIAKNILCFGPKANAAAIEGSKAFMKDLCVQNDIPTAVFAKFDEPDAAKEFIHRHGSPIVVKADGLAAGKGAIVCRNQNEAFAAIDHILIERAFGDAGKMVVVEEFLEGEEVSFFALVNGRKAIPFATAQDHKTAFDGDEGPNTGGMGAYSPAPIIDPDLQESIMNRIIRPTIEAMDDRRKSYSGVLFAGLIMTAQGPKLLEYNVRFGDPECQALLLRLDSDLLDVLIKVAEGRIDDIHLRWKPDPSIVVVMATQGYPGPHARGSEIAGVSGLKDLADVMVFHSGTQRDGDRLLANGGRVLGVTAIGESIGQARDTAYDAISKVHWPQGFYRRDIGWRAIGSPNKHAM